MAAKASFLLFMVAFFLLALSTTPSSAFNITRVLGQYPEYGSFNDLLTKTKLVDQINHRQTITLLVMDNASVSSITGRPADEIKNILMNHVILDYFDIAKIQKLGKKSAILTTLYQTTGLAQNQQGFVNITKLAPGEVVFGSAVKGAPLVAKLLGSVLSQPFNLSVLHVSTAIVAPGFGDPVLAPPPPPPGSAPPAPAPKKAEAPAPSEEEADEGEAPDSAPTLAPSDAPASDSPADAPTKGKSSEDADEEEEGAPAPSASSRMGSSIAVALLLGLVASFVAF